MSRHYVKCHTRLRAPPQDSRRARSESATLSATLSATHFLTRCLYCRLQRSNESAAIACCTFVAILDSSQKGVVAIKNEMRVHKVHDTKRLYLETLLLILRYILKLHIVLTKGVQGFSFEMVAS